MGKFRGPTQVHVGGTSSQWTVLYYRFHYDGAAAIPALQARDWCREQFGDEGPQPQARWSFFSFSPVQYYFRRMEDAFAFKMRWG